MHLLIACFRVILCFSLNSKLTLIVFHPTFFPSFTLIVPAKSEHSQCVTL